MQVADAGSSFAWLYQDEDLADCYLEAAWHSPSVLSEARQPFQPCGNTSVLAAAASTSSLNLAFGLGTVPSSSSSGPNQAFGPNGIPGLTKTAGASFEKLVHGAVLGSHSEYFRAALQRWRSQAAPGQAGPDKAGGKFCGKIALRLALDSDAEGHALPTALEFMYKLTLPPDLSHRELLPLLQLADRLQAGQLTAAAVHAWKALPAQLLDPQLAAQALVSPTTASASAWGSTVVDTCVERLQRAFADDPAVVTPAVQAVLQRLLGDALAVANTHLLRQLFYSLPLDTVVHWARDMDGLVTDSEDTVLYLLNGQVPKHAACDPAWRHQASTHFRTCMQRGA